MMQIKTHNNFFMEKNENDEKRISIYRVKKTMN